MPARGKPLASGKGLARSGKPKRKRFADLSPAELAKWAENENLRREMQQGKRAGRAKSRKDTIPRKVRLFVLERDGYCCVCCGRSIIGQRYSLGHRLRASQGGNAVPSNLVVLLGFGGERCHGRIDLYRDRADAAKGYRLLSGQNPQLISVMVFSAGGSGATVWLDDLGNYLTEPPEGHEAT